jgi:hypothetical protein
MKELDLLKKDWKKNNAFEQVSEQDIYTMLHKKSSSVVKWILIVSILEFVILNGIAFFISDKAYDKIMSLHPYLGVLDKANYVIIIAFIYLFYKNYKAISVLHSSKALIEHILKTRKIVTYYIYWNIIIGGISGALSGIESFNKGYKTGYNADGDLPEKTKEVLEANNITAIIIALVVMGFLWIFYKLLYGGFLRKLKENYSELKKIDL